MIYIEYIDRDRSMPLEVFRYLGRQSSDWNEDSSDRLVLQIGRTLRLGPEPTYMAFWDIPDISRLDKWEHYFSSPESLKNQRSTAMHRAIHIKRAGLYDNLFAASELKHPLYYIEYYSPSEFDSAADVSALLDQAPLSNHDGLLYVLRRVGWLGPEAEGIAVWGCRSYRDVDRLSRQNRHAALRPICAGVYKDFGSETL